MAYVPSVETRNDTFGRRASYSPNDENESVSGKPIQLHFQQYDATLRDDGAAAAPKSAVPKPNFTHIQNRGRKGASGARFGTRAWFTKPKIIIAAVALAVLLLLIIVLPLVLTLANRGHTEQQQVATQPPSAATVAPSVVVPLQGSYRATLRPANDTDERTFEQFMEDYVKALFGGAQRRFRRDDEHAAADNASTSASSTPPTGTTTTSLDLIQGIIETQLQSLLAQYVLLSELCEMLDCDSVEIQHFSVDGNNLVTNFEVEVAVAENGTRILPGQLADAQDALRQSVEEDFAEKFGSDFALDDSVLEFDFGAFCESELVDCSDNSTANATTTTTPEPTTTTAEPTMTPAFRQPPPVAVCSGNAFNCTDDPTTVVGLLQICDGHKDCADGSDEIACVDCRTSFRCADVSASDVERMSCLRGSDICDGVPHCPSGDDERRFCDKPSCNDATDYQCEQSSTCIPRSYLCDGDRHCPLGDDETKFCTSAAVCQNNARWCEPSGQCLPVWAWCDGVSHCSDGSDEQSCKCEECAGNGAVLCSLPVGVCIRRSSLCDGRHNCPGGEDEINCPGWCPDEANVTKVVCSDGLLHPLRWACSGLLPQCERHCHQCDGELAFECGAGTRKCIPRRQVCDSAIDCTDGSDEAPQLCTCDDVDRFRCKSAQNAPVKCIASHYLCDGYHDCPEGDDEEGCSEGCVNYPMAVFCAADRRCYPSSSRCDGIVDCADYSDEDGCTCAACKSHDYETFLCRESARCLRKDYVCNSASRYHCPGAAPEDEQFCHHGWDPLQADYYIGP